MGGGSLASARIKEEWEGEVRLLPESKPTGNALAVVDAMGKYGIWESVVPSSMKSPTEGIPSSQSKNNNGLLLFDEEDEEQERGLNISGSLSDFHEDSFGKSEPTSRKRLRNCLHMMMILRKSQKERLDKGKGVERSSIISGDSKIQEAFQPGSTPVQPGKRRFLCYNMLGTISTMEQDGYSHIELMQTQWSMRFEEEEVKVVALGTSWVAPSTSLNFLRIFSEGGLQKNVISLDGPVVTASGFRDELAVVTHASPSLPSNDEMLEFRVFNICNGTQPIRGRIPVTPGSYLTWFGFRDEGQICSFDSKGVLRVYTEQYGGSWLLLFSSGKVKKAEENYWIIGLNAYKLFCVVCKSPDSFPQIYKIIEETVAIGLDTTALDDEAFNTEASLDKCILKLIASCCNGDKLVRATELVKLLTLEKSVKGAIKLVTTLKLPNLAERFNSILEPDNSVSKSLTSMESSKTSEPDIPSTSQMLYSPPLIKKEISEAAKAGKVNLEHKKIVKLKSIGVVKSEGEFKGEVKKEDFKKVNEVNQALPRPSNPFAKPSKNQEKSSLFESLKRMKNEA
ncbi:transducin family protein [Actinidia rufa]|uniref:Transducin family protein n=1 Tax=Actinidia rufa TaxID=165716 RepID=A0A7J0H1D0_9ERIC|nr:transducin family protein [Actinidia rufa]